MAGDGIEDVQQFCDLDVEAGFLADLPAGCIADRLADFLPAAGDASGVWADGKRVAAKQRGDRWVLEKDVSGKVILEVK